MILLPIILLTIGLSDVCYLLPALFKELFCDTRTKIEDVKVDVLVEDRTIRLYTNPTQITIPADSEIQVSGSIVDKRDKSKKVNGIQVECYVDNTTIANNETDSSGTFHCGHIIPNNVIDILRQDHTIKIVSKRAESEDIWYGKTEKSFDLELKIDPDRNPIILIPGVMGSVLVDRNSEETLWDPPSTIAITKIELEQDGEHDAFYGRQIEPLRFIEYDQIYPDLINFLKVNMHYEEGKNLFYFPYDWRKRLEEAAEDLKDKTKKWRTRLDDPKTRFIVVAHSMGGLIARYFIVNLQGDDYIKQLIMLGTPHKGTPQVFRALTEGDRYIAFLTLKEDLEDIRKISRSFPALYYLLPQWNFIIEESLKRGLFLDPKYNWDLPEYQKKYLKASEEFHTKLSQPLKENVEAVNIYASDQPTISFVSVRPDHKFIFNESNGGDTSVLESSVISFNGAKNYLLKERIPHSTLPKSREAQKLIKNFILKSSQILLVGQNKNIHSLLEAGDILLNKGDPDGAESIFEDALYESRNIRSKEDETRSLLHLAIAKRHRGDDDGALRIYEELLNTTENPFLNALAFNNRGLIFQNSGKNKDTEKALQNYKNALRLFKALGLRENEVLTLHNIAIVRYEKGDIPAIDAIRVFDETLDISKQIGYRKGEIASLINRGEIYSRQEQDMDKEFALNDFEKALEISRNVEYNKGQAISLISIAKINCERKQMDKASKYYKDLRALQEELKIKSMEKLDVSTKDLQNVEDCIRKRR